MPHRPQPHVVTDRARQFKSGPVLGLLVLIGAAIGCIRLVLVGTGTTGLRDFALVIGVHVYLLGLFPILLSWAFPFTGRPDAGR